MRIPLTLTLLATLATCLSITWAQPPSCEAYNTCWGSCMTSAGCPGSGCFCLIQPEELQGFCTGNGNR